MPRAKTYPLDIRNVGDDTYVVMSKGHHDPHAFMAAVRAAGYGDWPLGVPRLVWLKTTPCAPSCGEHHCHYQLSDEQRKGWTPATYAHEAPQDECYKPPADAGVRVDAPAGVMKLVDDYASVCNGLGNASGQGRADLVPGLMHRKAAARAAVEAALAPGVPGDAK